jgi:hypothetical protein
VVVCITVLLSICNALFNKKDGESIHFLCLSILFESFVDFHALLLIVSSLESVYCCFILE